MYVIEISEDKMDGLIECVGKAFKYITKTMECLEEMKEHSSEEDDYYDDEEDDKRDMMKRGGRRRMRQGGRYNRY